MADVFGDDSGGVASSYGVCKILHGVGGIWESGTLCVDECKCALEVGVELFKKR